MRGRKIINEFYKLFHRKYDLRIPNFYADIDNGLYPTFDDILDEFKRKPKFNRLINVKFLLEIFKEASFNPDFLTDHLDHFRKIEIIDFTHNEYKGRNRAFFYFDNDFGFFSLKKTFQESLHTNSFVHKVSAIEAIQQFVASCIVLREIDKLKKLLDCFEQGEKDAGLLLQKRSQRCESISIFSHVFFRFLCQGGEIEIDNLLKYVSPLGFNPGFIRANKYNQFFELFDVINEVNLAKDVVSRFLKVYHILEYLAYRVKLVEVEAKARQRKTFIREITSLKKENEEGYIIDCFNKVFIAEIPTFRTSLSISNPLKLYIEKQFGVKQSTFTNPEYLPRLIYRIRNSIVHNKESEFHITSSNPEEFSRIITLMHKLVSKLEVMFYQSMNTPHAAITYGSSAIKLY